MYLLLDVVVSPYSAGTCVEQTKAYIISGYQTRLWRLINKVTIILIIYGTHILIIYGRFTNPGEIFCWICQFEYLSNT